MATSEIRQLQTIIPGLPPILWLDDSNIKEQLEICRNHIIIEHPLLIIDDNVAKLHSNLIEMMTSQLSIGHILKMSHPEPTVDNIEALAHEALYSNQKFDKVISIGGGSTIDCAKGLCHLLPEPRRLPTSFEMPGKFLGKTISHVCFPTTLGSGSEISPAMIYGLENGRKTCIVDDRLVPSIVIIIPKFFHSLGRKQIVICALDGIVHAIEVVLWPQVNPLVKLLGGSACRFFFEGLKKNSENEIQNQHNEEAYKLLAYGSIFSSIALRLSRAGFAHAMAGVLGETIQIPHGQIVGIILFILLKQHRNQFVSDCLKGLWSETSSLSYESLTTGLDSLIKETLPDDLSLKADIPNNETINHWSDLILGDSRANLQIWDLSKQHIPEIINKVVGILWSRRKKFGENKSGTANY
ncbi:MAG: iron-containing alcohol dehydrogenase [Vulcanimicrobiota bacterium]